MMMNQKAAYLRLRNRTLNKFKVLNNIAANNQKHSIDLKTPTKVQKIQLKHKISKPSTRIQKVKNSEGIEIYKLLSSRVMKALM